MTRHRRQNKPDRVLVALKVATFLAAAGLVGLIILWASGGGQDKAAPRPTSPTPVITQPGDDAPPTTTVTTIEPPALRTETSTIALKPPPPSNTPKPPPPSTRPTEPSGINFPVVGQPCPEPGMWSVTSNYEPVVCASNPPGSQPRWIPVF